METLSIRQARRLALARAGLLRTPGNDLPARATGSGKRALRACEAVIGRFGYLQLDSVSVTGARTHGITLASRLDGFDTAVAETLLRPGGLALFEYWGHEACWLPLELYPHFAFRRRAYRVHPWWGAVLDEHAKVADRLLRRIADEGPLRSLDMEGRRPEGTDGWWNAKLSKRVAEALWSAGELAVRERRGFQRTYDLVERVIPPAWRERPSSDADAYDALLLKALDGHGWATTGTLAATWRLRNCRPEIEASLERLREDGRIVPAALEAPDRRISGWVRPAHLELAARLDSLRPRRDRGVLLSPFDPLLWDRGRTLILFGFEQVLEIYKPAPQRRFGYYCLPVLAGERLVGRVDLKADRGAGLLHVVSRHTEPGEAGDRTEIAIDGALTRFAGAVGLGLAR